MRLVRTFGVIALLAFAVPSSGLAVAPQNPQVVQDGAFFRVSWTPDADSTTGVTAQVSNVADFGWTTCNSTSLFSNQTQPAGTLRVWCPIAFGDTVYVRITNAGGESTDIQAPSASFDFRPIGPNTSGTARNRQLLTCRLDPREWQRMNEEDDAIVKMSLWVGGRVRVEEATFTSKPTDAPIIQQTLLKGTDVGATARCLTTMTYGAYTGTSVRTYRVVHALPEQMQPTMILQEAQFPRVLPNRTYARRKVSSQLRAIGALSAGRTHQAANHGSLQGDVNAMIFATPSLADRYLGTASQFCSSLRARVKATPVTGVIIRVTTCGRVTISRSRRAYGATLVVRSRQTGGAQLVGVVRFIAGTAGHGQYDVTDSETGPAARLTRIQTRVRKTAALSARAIALGLSRE